jgi:hypothetical protein
MNVYKVGFNFPGLFKFIGCTSYRNLPDDRLDKEVVNFLLVQPTMASARRLDADVGPCCKSAGLLYHRKALRFPEANTGCHVINFLKFQFLK